MHTIPVIAQGSTRSVDPAQRVNFWEEHNRRHLVGLTCSSYAAEGLRAAGVNYAVGDLRLADISGGAHVIERSPELCRTEPKDAVFASRLVDGTGFFYHGQGCLAVSRAAAAGVSVRHLTRLFEHEGTTPARHIAERRSQRAREQLCDPIHLDSTIADVAHQWGFASHAHFTRVFRRAFGEAPRDVRPGHDGC